jgi:hypothetical protein
MDAPIRLEAPDAQRTDMLPLPGLTMDRFATTLNHEVVLANGEVHGARSRPELEFPPG